jgi:hypothetical protein
VNSRTELQEKTFHDLDIFVAPPAGNILCELPSGVTAYAIWVKLIALRSNVRVENCRIVSAWDLESIVLCGNERGVYRVGHAVNLAEDEVLNHRIENGLHFHRRGDVAEGWLVASGYTPIPGEYRNWKITTLSLTFTDQFGNDYSARADAALQRSAGLKNSVSRIRRSRGLFEIGGDLEKEIRSREVPTSTLRRGLEQPGIYRSDRQAKYSRSVSYHAQAGSDPACEMLAARVHLRPVTSTGSR